MEYSIGNLSDKYKQMNLSYFLPKIARVDFFQYFELHSGEGLGRTEKGELFPGSAMLVMDMLKTYAADYFAYLNEKIPERRRKLRKTISSFFDQKNFDIDGDFHENIENYIELADKNSLFFIDPSNLTDYENDGLLETVPKLLETPAKIVLYAPQSLKIKEAKQHKSIINKIMRRVRKSGRDFEVFKAGINNSKGYLRRTDHNINIY